MVLYPLLGVDFAKSQARTEIGIWPSFFNATKMSLTEDLIFGESG